MDCVGRKVHSPARNSIGGRLGIWHRVNSHAGVFELFWRDLSQVVHHRFDCVDKAVGTATFPRYPWAHHDRTQRSSGAAVNPGHTPHANRLLTTVVGDACETPATANLHQSRVRRIRYGDADLRLCRPGSGGGSAGTASRTPLLRPVSYSRRADDCAPGLEGGPLPTSPG